MVVSRQLASLFLSFFSLSIENPETRATLFDELMECESFLCQRLVEIRKDDDVLSVNQFQNADLILQVAKLFLFFPSPHFHPRL